MWQDNHLFAFPENLPSNPPGLFGQGNLFYTFPHWQCDPTYWMTESLSIDLSVHQSASCLHWNIPVNKSCKPSVIFILPRKKWKWSWRTFGQGHGEFPCQSWITEASDSSSHPQAAGWSCFLVNFSKISATLKAKGSRRHLYGDSTHFSNECIASLIIKKI